MSEREWRVRICQPGVSVDGNNRYRESVLRPATDAFHMAPIYAYERWIPSLNGWIYDHLTEAEREVVPGRNYPRNLIGFVKEPRWQVDGVHATMSLLPHSQGIEAELWDGVRRGHLDHLGLSMETVVKTQIYESATGPVEDVTEIGAVNQVNIVTWPSAGGRVYGPAGAMDSTDERTLREAILLARVRLEKRYRQLEAALRQPLPPLRPSGALETTWEREQAWLERQPDWFQRQVVLRPGR